MRKALAAACAAGGLAPAGCFTGSKYQNCVDPCYPNRYNAVARQEVVSAFAPQVQNGHILDQTVWNYHFEPGTARLSPGGMDKLDQLVRRRPEPDPRVFLATARDIQYNADDPDKYADTRRDLDGARVVAVQKYLAAQTVGRPYPFEVLVHDPVDPSMNAVAATRAVQLQRFSYIGSLSGGVGGAAGGLGGIGGIGGMGGSGLIGSPGPGGTAPGTGSAPATGPGPVPSSPTPGYR